MNSVVGFVSSFDAHGSGTMYDAAFPSSYHLDVLFVMSLCKPIGKF